MRSILAAAVLTVCALIACGGDAETEPDLAVREAQPPAFDTGDIGTGSPRAPDGSRTAEELEAPLPEEGVDAGASDCPPTKVISDVSEKGSASGAAVNTTLSLCGPCHSPEGAQRVRPGPSNVADFNLMIDEGFVVDCSADLSPIIISMRANEMPPPGYLGFSPSAEIDVIGRFIELDCSDEERACAISPAEAGCDEVLSARRERRCAW